MWDVDVTVSVAGSLTNLTHRLEQTSPDAIIVDGESVDVPGVLDRVGTVDAQPPVYVQWNGTGPIPVDTDTALEDTLTGTFEPALQELLDQVKLELFDTPSPGEIDRIVREAMTAIDHFAFTWTGEYDRGEREVVPWVTDLDTTWEIHRTFEVTGDSSNPLDRCLTERQLQVTAPDGDGETVPLGPPAGDRGVETVAFTPLYTQSDVYGAFVVYATDALTESDRAVIEAIGAAISRTLESIAVSGQLPQLKRERHRYERLVETAGDGMFVLDAEGHCTTVNSALVDMTGYSREGLLGEHVSLLFEEVRAQTDSVRRLISAGAFTDTIELTLDPKAGPAIPCETQLALLHRNGTVDGAVGVVRDVTERKHREQRLRTQNERLDAFTSIVSHDLRNPLSVSSGYLELLVDEEGIDHEYVEHIRGSIERMDAIVEDVLAIAREGEWASDLEAVDVATEAQAAWDHVSTGDAELQIDDASTLEIEADRSRLLRLLENLFRNAIEHGEASVVRLGHLGSPSDPGGFYVEDDGAGVPEPMRERIFDPSVSTGADGLGIGLWVVKEVADAHEWSVSAVEGRDGGARFEFEN